MIPILDWRSASTSPDTFTADLGRACRDTGFFLLSHHDVPSDLCDRVFAQADAFFSMPDVEKERLAINHHFRGWARPGQESLDETRPEIDTKQTFNIGLDLAPDDPRVIANEPFHGVNIWPDLPGFAETMLAYYKAALTQGIALHRFFARDLGLSVDHFDSAFHDPLAALRLLHYPPASGAAHEIGAGEHTDYGAITLLMTDGEPGLQVKPRNGDWIDVPAMPGAFVVNIGDCLMRWTSDIYVSTPHRVLPPKNQRRSVAMFVETNPDQIIAGLPGTGAAKYPPIRAADYLMSRLNATYLPKETV